jgi:hypothetical protein
MEVRHRHDVGVGEVVGVMLLLEPETGEERGGSGEGDGHVGRLKESNSKFQMISNKFKTVQIWFVPKRTFPSLKILK